MPPPSTPERSRRLSPRSALLLLALTLPTAGAGCRGACRTLAHCDSEQCAVLSAVPVGQERPRPVGCIDRERDNQPGVSTYARDGAGACWIFPTTLVADGFTADDSCRP
jgi:hypothetical protein